MAFGMEAVAGGVDLLAIGDIGVGGSTAAAAIFAALYGGSGADWTGPGSGADAAMIARKAAVIDRGLALHGAHLKDPLEVLRRFGGREFAAIAGAILAARMEKVPVVLDGFAATAAAAILHRANPGRARPLPAVAGSRPSPATARRSTSLACSRCSISASIMAKGREQRWRPVWSRSQR